MTLRIEVQKTTDMLFQAFGLGTFTVAQANDIGVTRQRLRSAVAAGVVRRPRRGIYSLGDSDLARACIAVQDLTERGVVAAIGVRTAGGQWGIGAFGSRGRLKGPLPTVLMSRDGPMREGERYGVRFRVADFSPRQLTVMVPAGMAEIGEVPITTPIRTALDIAREQGRCRVSALTPLCLGLRAEFAWQGGWLSPGEPMSAQAAHEVTDALQDAMIRHQLLGDLRSAMLEVNAFGMHWPWKVLPDVQPLLETVLEVVAWACFAGSGLPRPVPQAQVRGASGRTYRADFLIGDRVIVEVDGAGKYSDTTPWAEKQRQSDLEAAGYWVVRCTWEELLRSPTAVIDRIWLALTRSCS